MDFDAKRVLTSVLIPITNVVGFGFRDGTEVDRNEISIVKEEVLMSYYIAAYHGLRYGILSTFAARAEA